MTHPANLPIEERRARDRERYHKAGDKKRAQMQASRAKHAEKRRASDRERYHTNPARREYQLNQANSWWKLSPINRAKANFMVARSRAWTKLATPPWLTKEQKKEIRAFYIEAKHREGEWHVDHIVPLRHKLVCGLHVPWNLQLLPGDENRRKTNAFTPT